MSPWQFSEFICLEIQDPLEVDLLKTRFDLKIGKISGPFFLCSGGGRFKGSRGSLKVLGPLSRLQGYFGPGSRRQGASRVLQDWVGTNLGSLTVPYDSREKCPKWFAPWLPWLPRLPDRILEDFLGG